MMNRYIGYGWFSQPCLSFVIVVAQLFFVPVFPVCFWHCLLSRKLNIIVSILFISLTFVTISISTPSLDRETPKTKRGGNSSI
ncbi:hypothetical protein BC829DRAFT_394895 [Chytridium lagenaria]|nr:hypothetical protein BC829DRAFT_394895 [Chytridium lagenaria]